MNVSMDLVLDEAESAFLQAILTGTEAGPVFDVARGLEVPSTQLNSYIVPDALSSAFGAQGADAATLRVDGPGVPTSHAIQSLQPYNKPPSYCTAHAIYRSPVTSESSIAVQKRQPWQQDLLPPGRAAESQSCIASVTSGQQPQSDLLQNQTLRQQEINSRAASPRVHKGALFAIHAAIATAATNDPSGDGRLSPTAPTGCHQPCVTQLQLCGGTPAPGSLAATAPPACTSTSSMPALSNTDSAISAVSEPSALAKKRTPPTESVCMLHGRRRWSSANLGTAPRGGVSAGSSSSRSFSSAAAIPCASNFAAAAASVMKGSRSASASSTAAVTTAAVPPTAPPSRRTHGLLEHIQNLEAQLTELLLATSDCDEAESNPLGPTAGSAVSASAGMCAAQRHGLPAEAASRLTDPSGPNDRPTDLNHNVHRQQHGKTPCLRNGPWHPHQVVVRLAAGGSVGNPQAAYYSRRQLLVFSVAEQLCRDYNSSGVALMEAGLDEAAREQLDKALLLAGPKGPLEGRTEKQRELQIVAHNNLACYYRKLGQPSLALQHLQHTARLEAAAAAATDPTEGSAEGGLLSAHYVAGAEGNGGGGGGGGSDGVGTGGGGGADGGDVLLAGLGPGRGPTAATLLNLAACSSSLGQHTQALSYATRALQSAAGELQIPLPHLEAALLQRLPQVQLSEVLPQLRRACPGAMTQLAMAYYNRAVEQEHLRLWQAAMESYQLAVDVASRFVGRGDDLTLTIQQSAEAFKAQFRKLAKQGRVRNTRVGTHGVLGSSGTLGAGRCPSLSPTLSTGNVAMPGPGPGCAALPRPHPHLRPLLRCATTANTPGNGTAHAAATAAAAATEAHAPRNAQGLPSIASTRPSTTPSSAIVPPYEQAAAQPPSPIDVISPVSWAKNSANALEAALAPVPRRALSAGRDLPQRRQTAVTLLPGRGPPVTSAGWVQLQAGHGNATHLVMAPESLLREKDNGAGPAEEEGLQRRGGVSAAMAVRGVPPMLAQRNSAWSPPLPPKPRSEASGDGLRAAGGSGDHGSRCAGSASELAGPPMGTLCWLSGPRVPASRGVGSSMSPGNAPVIALQPPPVSPRAPAPAPEISVLATVSSFGAIDVRIRQDASAPTTAPVGTTPPGVLSTNPFTTQQNAGKEPASKGGESLAAVAAEAIAAADELAKICAAGEDGLPLQLKGRDLQGYRQKRVCGQVQVHEDVDEDQKTRASGHGPSRTEVKSASPQPLAPAQSPPAGMSDSLGRNGPGDVCRKGGGSSPSRLGTHYAAGTGNMLVPKRDGVAV